MTTSQTDHPAADGARGPLPLLPPPPLFLLRPLLARIVRKVAARNPGMFARLGPHAGEHFLIDPVDMPFMLHLRPDPDALDFRAVGRRGAAPPHVARISGTFLNLFTLMDSEQDGDALFFSRDLVVTGDTEAVVCLRNALDDVEEPIAHTVAAMFGPPGRLALDLMRSAADTRRRREEAQP
ncbi:SCP2 domain-containing protein [Rhodovulum sp. 12E13]|uniref:ubiquinone anaerobic biosynthesis accessory factor UbiT n=1 Tax=Rhodovulum sp. 12E13 TaxID=2203891 RepID=UPI0018F3881C|nr:SCP2 sterol-binding domain-containing protein [Rhodovulum sp. 12E13]